MSKTVRIRIPVAVASTGAWEVGPASEHREDDEAIGTPRSRLMSSLHHGDTQHIVWIVAEVPLPPEPVEVVGQVEEVKP